MRLPQKKRGNKRACVFQNKWLLQKFQKSNHYMQNDSMRFLLIIYLLPVVVFGITLAVTILNF